MTMTFKKSDKGNIPFKQSPKKTKSKGKKSRDVREDRGTRQSKLGNVKNPRR
jgi:hypothetical protein